MSRVLFAAFVLLADAGASRGEGAKTDLYGDPLPPGAVARLGTVRLRHYGADVAFSKDGKCLISCGTDGAVRTWDTATGRLLREKRLSWGRPEAKQMATMELSPDGTTAVGLDKEVAYVCDTNTGKNRGRIPSIVDRAYKSLLTFSSDGKLLAVQSCKGRFITEIWDVNTVKKYQTLKNPSGSALASVAFTWDGKQLAGIAEKKDFRFDLFLWDVATGKLIRQRENLCQIDADSLAFSPDGKTLAVGGYREHGVRLLDAMTLKEKTQLKPPANVSPHLIDHLTFSPDGRCLAAAYSVDPTPGPAEHGVLIWELAGSKEARRLSAWHGARLVFRLVFAPDSKTLACRGTSGSAIRLWDVATGRPLHQRPGHDAAVMVLAVSPDGKIVVSGDSDDDAILRLWDTTTGKQLRVLGSHPFKINLFPFCVFSPDGKQVVCDGSTAGANGGDITAFQVWDVATGKALRQIETKEEAVPVHASGISTDGKRLAAVVGSVEEEAFPTRLIVWNLATGERLSQRPYKVQERTPAESDHDSYLRTMTHAALAPDGERVTVWLGDRVGIEEVSTGCLLAPLPKGVGQPLWFSPDGRLLAAAVWQPRQDTSLQDYPKGLSLIDTASGEEVIRLELESFPRIAFTPDSRGLLVVDGERLRVWDTATGEKLYERKVPKRLAEEYSEHNFCPMAMLPGGRMATGMSLGDILVWDLAASTWPARTPVRDLSREDLDSLWADLAGSARKAHRAIAILAAVPDQTVPFLKDRLRPAAVDTKRIEKLLADLNGDSFEVREAASHELIRLHYRVEPILRRILEGKPSLELRRRLEAILAGPKRPLAEDLRALRAMEVLERIGTPQARRILETFACGEAVRETREAKAALQRLNRR